ncbi:META domain-containing protein [Actinokineospora enzanensis]|uniref:META domain-containing protein n=1 Tax=Actinokineospora enzanensis TaxID=155975 RepID=UPI00036FCD38|nr:META domain-containing protein [Actinokineospora enzanensis]
MRTRHLTPAVLAALVLAGCGQSGGSTTPAGQPPAALDGPIPQGRFTAETATDNGAPHALVPGSSVTLDFQDGGRLSAAAGCNTIGGSVSLAGGTLQTAELSSTEMACDEARHRQDEWLSALLTAKPVWKLADDRLTLTSATTELVLGKAKPANLVGPKWALESLLDGQSASSTPDTGKASLTFEKDQVMIRTGCNSGSAPYTVEGTTLRFEPPMLTKMACADGSAAVESAVVAVLGEKVEYAIDGQSLTLTNGAKALQLRATTP